MMLSLALHVVIAGLLLVSAVLVTHNLVDVRPQMMVASLNYSYRPGDPGQLEPQQNTLQIPQAAVIQVDTNGSSTIHIEELERAEQISALLVIGPVAEIPKIDFGNHGRCGCVIAPAPIQPRPDPSPVGPALVKQRSSMHEAVLLEKVDPEYPAFAKRAGIHGAVVLHAIVDREGRISGLSVVSGPNQLRQAALDAVRQWRYQAYVLNGLAVDIETTIRVNFVLPDAVGRNPSRIL